MASLRLIHDKQASAAAASKTYVWLPRENRRTKLTAGVELDRDDLDAIITALWRQREQLLNQIHVIKQKTDDPTAVQEIESQRSALRRLEFRLTTARDDLKAEQAWRDYEGKHPHTPRHA